IISASMICNKAEVTLLLFKRNMKLIGFYLSQVMAACEHPTNRFALSGGAAVVNIGAHALLLRSRSILSTGINDLRVSGLHPTPMQRMRALAYTDCYLAPEYK